MPNFEDYEKFRVNAHLRVWVALGAECQEQARQAFWHSKDLETRESRKAAVLLIAQHHRFRPKFVEQARFEKKVDWMQPLFHKRDGFLLLADFVRVWLKDHRGKLMLDFLDALGLKHIDGELTEACEAPDEARIDAAANKLLETHDRREVGIYMCYLCLMPDNRAGWSFIWKTETAEQLMREILEPDLDQVSAATPDQSGNASELEAVDVVSRIAALIDEEDDDAPILEPADLEPAGGIAKSTTLTDDDATANVSGMQTPEDCEDFTTLDNRLILTAVAAAVKEEGALTEEQLEDLIEEVVDLNAGRHRSLFHRGFLHSLFDRVAQFHFPGENAQRRQWYMLGFVFGLLRRNETTACIKLLTEEQKDLGQELTGSYQTACGKKLLPPLCRPLLDSGHFKFALNFAAKQFPRLDEGNAIKVAETLHEFASLRFRDGHPGEAEEIADLLLQFLEESGHPSMDTDYQSILLARIHRLKAQCLQARGDFSEARHFLAKLIESGRLKDSAKALADLGLIEGGFRHLANILPRSGKNENQELLHSLKKGRKCFKNAIEKEGRQATNAHFAMGLILTLEEDVDTAPARVDYFRAALSGMAGDPEVYSVGGMQEWSEFLLTLALLETAELGNSVPAADHLPAIIKTQTRFPVYLWQRMLAASAIFDDTSIGIRIVEHLLAVRQEVESLLSSVQIFSEKKDLLETVLERYLKLEIPVKARWQTLYTLLHETLKGRHPEVAGTILDSLEGIALKEKEFRSQFADLLENSNNYSPAWKSDDASDSRSYLLEIEGRFDDAAALLRERFYREKAEGQPHNINAAREIIERIQEFRGTSLDTSDLEKLLPSDEVCLPVTTGLNGRVLYIGGNETQANYLPQLKSEIYRVHPDLEVEYYLPGWDSNWHIHLGKLKPMVDWADVVVINSFVRTQLGRHLRQYCGSEHPWRPCTGRGLESLKRSILQAAAWRCTCA